MAELPVLWHSCAGITVTQLVGQAASTAVQKYHNTGCVTVMPVQLCQSVFSGVPILQHLFKGKSRPETQVLH